MIVGCLTTGLALWFVFRVFTRSSSTSDEAAALWHAKMLAHGWLALPADPNPEFFAIDNVIDTGYWYSHFPIGGPLVLVPGVWLGATWLVNPVLAGLSSAALYHFARVAFGDMHGRAIALLFTVTPSVLMMAGTALNHVPTLFLCACALAALVEWDRAAAPIRRGVWGACVGLAVGAMATIRPLDAVVVALAIGGFQLVKIARDSGRAVELLVQAATGVLALTPLLYANWATNGSPLRFGYDVMWGEGHRLGFHADPRGELHTVGRAFEYAVTYIGQLNLSVLLWPVPAMAVVVAGLVAMPRASRWDVLLLSLAAAQVAGYSAYWGFGQFLGPRFLFTAYPAVIALIARAPFHIAGRVAPRTAHGILVFVVACVVVAWSAPAAYSARGLANQVAAARRTMRLDIAGAVREAGVHNAVVFIREPMSSRLLHRLWGVGVPRSYAAALLVERDACSLLSAIRRAEADPAMTSAERVAYVARTAAPFNQTGPVRAGDPQIRISSSASLTPECEEELDAEGFVPASFGAALPLLSFGRDGRLGGDVIYAMDLGAHNDVLRERFRDRTWYRVAVSALSDGRLHARLVAY